MKNVTIKNIFLILMFQILTVMSNNLLIKITDNEKEMFAKGRTCVNLFT